LTSFRKQCRRNSAIVSIDRDFPSQGSHLYLKNHVCSRSSQSRYIEQFYSRILHLQLTPFLAPLGIVNYVAKEGQSASDSASEVVGEMLQAGELTLCQMSYRKLIEITLSRSPRTSSCQDCYRCRFPARRVSSYVISAGKIMS